RSSSTSTSRWVVGVPRCPIHPTTSPTPSRCPRADPVSLPTISIVLPLYNGERHVAEAIQSVLSQTFGDFELLVCDDGSSDATASIAATFDDPRIRRMANARNLGLFPTLNRLVAEARGRYVRFWSQDDRMKPDCLAVEMAFWRAHPNLGLTYCL